MSVPTVGRGAVLLALALMATASPVAAQSTAQERERAALRQIRMLPPSAFPELPAAVRADLEKRGCAIPQVFDQITPRNVVRGSFARAGQTDRAVLCSVRDSSSILLYWGGPARCPSLDERTANRNWLQGVGDGRLGFSRALGVAGRGAILQHYRRYGGARPPRIDHEGIDDAFVEKASEVHYCFRGRWLTLQGAD